MHRNDFGTEESEAALVPEALRAYRHFMLFRNELWPMSHDIAARPNPYSPKWQVHAPEYHPSFCSCPVCADNALYGLRIPHPEPEPMVFESWCNKFVADTTYRLGYGTQPVVLSSVAHTSPQEDCSCGFYAHYGPDGDFYAGQKWDAFRGEGEYEPFDALHGFRISSNSKPYAFALVKAVVEMTGKVVLGTKGVRAEKMRIVAAALDWDKFQDSSVRADVMYDTWFSDPFERRVPYGYNSGPDPETMELGMATLQAISSAYGFKPYSDVSAMYGRYPQPDIGHLRPKGDE